MKVTFAPLDPKPVRVPDMPDGVAYEIEAECGDIAIRINKDGYTWSVDAEDKPLHRMIEVEQYPHKKVLRRRDGQPLPSGEPVPLDTLEPLPMWYSDGGGGYYSHDEHNGHTLFFEGRFDMHSGDADSILVHPQPYIMEVQR